MTRARLAAAAALAVVSLATAAHAQPWRAIEGRCVKQIGEQTEHWPAWVKCTARQLWGWSDRVQEVYAACWVPLWNERLRDNVCQQCGDPAGMALSCMARRLGK